VAGRTAPEDVTRPTYDAFRGDYYLISDAASLTKHTPRGAPPTHPCARLRSPEHLIASTYGAPILLRFPIALPYHVLCQILRLLQDVQLRTDVGKEALEVHVTVV
jgi:hypothetical protein